MSQTTPVDTARDAVIDAIYYATVAIPPDGVSEEFKLGWIAAQGRMKMAVSVILDNLSENAPQLRLYVFENFGPGAYSPRIALAIASNEADAKQQIIDRIGYAPFNWGNVAVFPLTERVARCLRCGD